MRIIPFLGLVSSKINEDIDFGAVFSHVCLKDGMYAKIKKTDLAVLGSWGNNFDSVTLNSQACSGTVREVDDMVIFNAGSFAEEPLECDTQMSSHYGKVTFWNMVQYTPPDDSVITRDTEGLFNFSCTYNMTVNDQKFELSLGHKIITSAIDRITFAGQEGKGNFSASMELFDDETFDEKTSYVDRGITLTLEQYLFIEIRLDVADKDISLKILECWATPNANAGSSVRHTLIRDGCKQDETVEILRSGQDQIGRWKAQMFSFINNDEVWLHCDIQACDSRTENCAVDTCAEDEIPTFTMSGSNQERKRRNVITVSSKQKRAATKNTVERGQVYEPNILTVGPIVNLEREKKKKQLQSGPITAIAMVGAVVAVAMIITIYKVLVLRRQEEDKIIEAHNNAVTHNNDWNLYGTDQQEGETRKNPMMVY